MVKILVCYDDTNPTIQLNDYIREVHPSLLRAGHDVQLTTHEKALNCLDQFHADILLLLIPTKGCLCWEVARHLRRAWNQNRHPPSILAIIAWPDDSPDDPAYFARSGYVELHDDYYKAPGAGDEISRWIDDFLAREQIK